MLRDLNTQGMTIVVVTHNPEVERLGRRPILLRDGRVVGDPPISSNGVAAGWVQAAREEAPS